MMLLVFAVVSAFALETPTLEPTTQEASDESILVDNPLNENVLNALQLLEPMNEYYHRVGFGLGFVFNKYNNGQNSRFFSGAFLGYDFRPFKKLFVYSNSLQDHLSFEIGSYVYSILNFFQLGDAYTLWAPYINLKYHLNFSTTVSAFTFIEFLKHIVHTSLNPAPDSVVGFSTQFISAGVGGYYTIGPGWAFRLKIGLFASDFSLTVGF